MGNTMALVAAFGFAINYVATRRGLLGMGYTGNIWEINVISLGSALSLYLLGMLLLGFNPIQEMTSLGFKVIFLLVVDGLLGPFIGTLLGIVAIAQIGAPHASALRGGSNPLFTTLMAVLLLGERPGLYGCLGVIIIVCGIIVVGYRGQAGITRLLGQKGLGGGIYALLSGLSFSLAHVARGAAVQAGATVSAGFIISISTGLIVSTIICFLMSGNLNFLKKIDRKNTVNYILSGFGIFLGLVGLLVAYRYIPVWQAIALRNTQPVLVLLISCLTIKTIEALSFRMIMGILLIAGGAVMVNF
jgi:drug/metabolite transporter (DMT)-like permease